MAFVELYNCCGGLPKWQRYSFLNHILYNSMVITKCDNFKSEKLSSEDLRRLNCSM